MQNPPLLSSLLCTSLKGVGARVAEHLSKCGVHTVQDLLFHLPARYEDRTRITAIEHLRQGDRVMIEGKIELADVTGSRRKSLICRLWDGTGYLTLRFFHFSQKQQESFKPGILLRCFGEIRGWSGEFEMTHPEYQFVRQHMPVDVDTRLTPVYPTTEGLFQRHWRSLTEQALDLLIKKPETMPDYLPAALMADFSLPTLSDALHFAHRPPADASVEELLAGKHPAQQRLAFEELMAHHLSLRSLRTKVQTHAAPSLITQTKIKQDFLNELPYQLTSAQHRVIAEIHEDIAKPHPMLRLVQGDVGSGKTVVAAMAALQAIDNQYQVALMAPTELLAEQHYRNFTGWFEKLGLELAWLTGRLKSKAREEMLEKIVNHKASIVIGTHALFQEEVVFAKLGLVIIDEQHRFGVHQRLALQKKGAQSDSYPHQLIMTATPIPRTLAMTAYADLDCSVIDELPPGRTPVKTVVLSDQRRPEIVERIRAAAREKRQAYWVCPLIEESEVLQCQAAQTTAEQLKILLPDIKIDLIHGRMSSVEKEKAMSAFKQGDTDLLVATTVIEVGVDVPNASLMVIENAERLGLAQLHQLRGRVGRGAVESYCVLIYQYPLSNLAKERLAVMRETNDGFVVAKRDLELRGPGEVLGTRQAGLLQMRVADLLRDQHLLPTIQQAAEKLLKEHPHFVEPLINRWLAQKIGFAKV